MQAGGRADDRCPAGSAAAGRDAHTAPTVPSPRPPVTLQRPIRHGDGGGGDATGDGKSATDGPEPGDCDKGRNINQTFERAERASCPLITR